MSITINGNNIKGLLYMGTLPTDATTDIAPGVYNVQRDYPDWIKCGWGFLYKPSDNLSGAYYICYANGAVAGFYYYDAHTSKWEKLAKESAISDSNTLAITTGGVGVSDQNGQIMNAHIDWVKYGQVVSVSGEMPFANGIQAGESRIALDMPKYYGSAGYQYAIDSNGKAHLLKIDNNGNLYIINPTAITGPVHLYVGFSYIAQ